MHSPAQAIHATLGTTIRAGAKLVGESESAWSRYVGGKANPTASKVQGWLESLERNGRTIMLAWGHEGCKVWSCRTWLEHETARPL